MTEGQLRRIIRESVARNVLSELGPRRAAAVQAQIDPRSWYIHDGTFDDLYGPFRSEEAAEQVAVDFTELPSTGMPVILPGSHPRIETLPHELRWVIPPSEIDRMVEKELVSY